jgi:hypothetical protein
MTATKARWEPGRTITLPPRTTGQCEPCSLRFALLAAGDMHGRQFRGMAGQGPGSRDPIGSLVWLLRSANLAGNHGIP